MGYRADYRDTVAIGLHIAVNRCPKGQYEVALKKGLEICSYVNDNSQPPRFIHFISTDHGHFDILFPLVKVTL